MNSTNPPHWEAPKFSFTTEDQAAEWKKILYTSTGLPGNFRYRPRKEG